MRIDKFPKIYFNETFATIHKVVTIHRFLAIVIAQQCELHQMDVHNAFLHGDFDEIYMHLPPSFPPHAL